MEIKVYGLPELEYLEGFGKLYQGKYDCIDLRLQPSDPYYPDWGVTVIASWSVKASISTEFVFHSEVLKGIYLLEDIDTLFKLHPTPLHPNQSSVSIRLWLEVQVSGIIPLIDCSHFSVTRRKNTGEVAYHGIYLPAKRTHLPSAPPLSCWEHEQSSASWLREASCMVLDQLLEIENNR